MNDRSIDSFGDAFREYGARSRTSRSSERSRTDVGGHVKLPVGGHENCP